MNEIDTSALSRFKKSDKPTTIDMSAFGKGVVEVQPKVAYEAPKGFLKTNIPKIPSFIARKTSEYIKKEEDISKNLSLADDFKRTFIEKPAEIVKFIAQSSLSIPQTLLRSGIEAIATPFGQKENIRTKFKQLENADETLFGGPVETYQQITEKIREGLDKSPDATLSEKKFLPGLVGIALLASDAFPGKGNVKKIGQEFFDELAKETNPVNIQKKMVDFGVDENIIKKTVPDLINAKTPEQVKQILIGKTGERMSEIWKASEIVVPTPSIKRPNITTNIRQLAIDQSQINTNRIKEEVLTGKREESRLSNPLELQRAIDYGSIPADKTPEDTVEVFRASDGEIKEGDFVTTDENRAKIYLQERPDSFLQKEIVKISDLVSSGGLKNEFVFYPKDRVTTFIKPDEQKAIKELLRRDQSSLRPIRATGAMDIKDRDLRKEVEDNIKKYNTKIPDTEIRAIREQNLLNPETIDEIIARKRGIITDAEAIERAKTIQGTLDDVLELPRGTSLTKEQYTAIEQIVQSEREINKSLKRALDEGITTGGAVERKLLTELNPDFTDKTDEELLRLAYQESTIKLKKAEIILLGIRSEAGRSLQATKQFVEGVDNRLRILFSRINNNKKLDEFEKQAMVETITKLDTADNKAFMKAIDDMSQSDMFDKIAEWSVAAKLWNPTTHIVNLGGNAIRQAIDIGIKTVTNPKLAKADMAGAMNGFKLGLRSGMRTFTEDGYAQQLSKYVELGGKAPSLKGKFGVAARTPFRVLAAGDEIFRNMAYQRKLYRDAYGKAKKEKLESPQLERRMEELLNTPTFEMMEAATKEAKKITFQEDLGDIVSKLNRLRDPSTYETKGGKTLGVILRTFLPFLKTPTNLFKQSVDFTPFGLAKNWTELKKAAKEGDQEKVGTILGEAILGTALVSYIAMETMDGNITGGVPSDPAEKDRFYREKKLPYAIKMGDTWYQYQRLDPLALIIGMTADMTGADDKSIGALVGTVSQNLQDKTYLSGVSDFMKMLTGEDWEREYALKSALLGSAFPSIVGHIARSTDPTVRVTDTVGQRLIAQTPGLSDELPARVNVLGYNVERANKGLNYFFNPIQTEKAGLDPVTKELMKIDKSISVPNKSFQSEGITYSLNDREYEDFARYTGIKLRYELLKTFRTPKYEKADIDEKYNIIDGLRKDIMDEWKKEYLKDQKEKTGKKQIIRNIIQGKDPNAPAELETKEKIKQYFLSK